MNKQLDYEPEGYIPKVGDLAFRMNFETEIVHDFGIITKVVSEHEDSPYFRAYWFHRRLSNYGNYMIHFHAHKFIKKTSD